MLVDAEESKENHPCSSASHDTIFGKSAETRNNLALDYVMVLRVMFQTKDWGKFVYHKTFDNLMKIPELIPDQKVGRIAKGELDF